MNAFIYASGRGNRLGKLVQERNKELFEFDFPWDVDFATHKVTPQILATDAEANQRKQKPVA